MLTSVQQHRAGDLPFLKRLNRSAILELVRRFPGLTRADIATQAQLTKATVGAGVQSLLELNWLREGELQKVAEAVQGGLYTSMTSTTPC